MYRSNVQQVPSTLSHPDSQLCKMKNKTKPKQIIRKEGTCRFKVEKWLHPDHVKQTRSSDGQLLEGFNTSTLDHPLGVQGTDPGHCQCTHYILMPSSMKFYDLLWISDLSLVLSLPSQKDWKFWVVDLGSWISGTQILVALEDSWHKHCW